MTETIPYVRDLRTTAATIAAQRITAGWHGRSEAVPCAVVEAAFDAIAPFLVDACPIEEAMAGADEQAESDPYRYLAGLQRKGELRIRTLEADEVDAPLGRAHARGEPIIGCEPGHVSSRCGGEDAVRCSHSAHVMARPQRVVMFAPQRKPDDLHRQRDRRRYA